MNCTEARDTALLRESGEATPEEAASLEEHLANCPACRKAITAEMETLNTFRHATVPPALPEHLRGKILTAADQAHREQKKAATIHEERRIIPFTIRASLAAAATIMLVFGIFLAQPDQRIYITPREPEPANITLPENITAAPESEAMTVAAANDLDELDALLGMLEGNPSQQPTPTATKASNASVKEETAEIMEMMDNFNDELRLMGGIS